MAFHFLVIQTASLGDVILSTPIVEKLHRFYPDARIDFLTKKGNEGLFACHPYLNEVLIWDKHHHKYSNLLKLLKTIQSRRYDYIINLQRHLSTGVLTACSRAKNKIGFDKNPLHFFFTKTIKHHIGEADIHEVNRNLSLIEGLTDDAFERPVLHPSTADYHAVATYCTEPYYCIAPCSLWPTKQMPENLWVELIRAIPNNTAVYLLGSKSDYDICQHIASQCPEQNIKNLASRLTLLESAALMSQAKMNFTNDSSPMHLASAMNAPITAIFCSTTIDFGFGPLSDDSAVVETDESLPCRPCGIHGHKQCPKGHYRCGHNIETKKLIDRL